MYNFCRLSILVLLMVFASSVEAKIVLSEQELKEKMINNKIYNIYLSEEGIVASGLNQYGVPEADDFVVVGSYDELPEHLYKLAQTHHVTILPSQRVQRVSNYQAILPLIVWVLDIILFTAVFIVLISINKKLSRILEISIKKQN